MRLAAAALLAGLLLLPHVVRASPQDPAAKPAQASGDERSPEVVALANAFQAAQYVTVSRDADLLLKGDLKRSVRVGILYMAAVSDARRGAWDDCLRHGKQYVEEAQGDPISTSDIGGYVLLAMAQADIAQGRVEEGVEVLDRLPIRYPALKDLEERVTLRAVCRASGPVFIDRSYRGKFVDDERFTAAVKSVEKAVPRAIAKIRDECKDPGLECPPIVVMFRDGSPESANGAMFTLCCTRDLRNHGVITILTEPLLTNSVDLVLALSHECIHAMRLARCGGDSGMGPPWLEEGLAEWGAGTGEARMIQRVLNWAVTWDSQKRVPVSKALSSQVTIEEQGSSLQGLCGSVVFWHIEQAKGKEVLRKVALRLVRESDWRRVLEEELKCTVSQLIAEARERYLAWTSKAFPGVPIFKEAYVLMEAGKYEKAVAVLDEFLGNNPSAFERPWMMLVRARALGDGGNRKAALECLRTLRLDYPQHSLVESSLWAEFWVLREESDWPAVIALGNTLLRDYAWQSTERESRLRKALTDAEASLSADKGSPPPEGGK